MTESKWSNESFVQYFTNGLLKRKREYGNFYVVKGNDCSILMYRTPRSHVAERLLGIHFNNSCVSMVDKINTHGERIRNFPSHSVLSNPDGSKDIVISSNLQHLSSGNDITKSKLIDHKKEPAKINGSIVTLNSILIDIEGSRWLLDFTFGDGKNLSLEEFKRMCTQDASNIIPFANWDARETPYQRKIYRINSNAKTVDEARLSLIPNENVKFIFNNMWFEPTDEIKEPIVQSNFIDRKKYGLSEEFAELPGVYKDCTEGKLLENVPDQTRSKLEKFMADWEEYKSREEKEASINIKNIKGIQITSSKTTEGGLFIDENEDVYVKGRLYAHVGGGYGSSDTIKLSCIFGSYKSPKKITTVRSWHKIIPIEHI